MLAFLKRLFLPTDKQHSVLEVVVGIVIWGVILYAIALVVNGAFTTDTSNYDPTQDCIESRTCDGPYD